MAKIVNLDELLGEDTILKYEGVEYRMPGDIDVETVFELFNMYVNIGVIDAEEPEQIYEEVQRKFRDIQARLLEILQRRNPKLKKLPFGIKGTGIVLRSALAELGIKIEQGDPTPSSPKPNRAARRSTARKTTTARKTKTASRRPRKR